jgi:sugar phosphate isomerase/epimerase
MSPISRRRFLEQSASAAACAFFRPVSAWADSGPALTFPTGPRERIAIASYPFREVIVDPEKDPKNGAHKIELKDFGAHVIEKFKINKVELWSGHFPSTDPKYLEQMRAAVESAHAMIVNMAVDGDHSPYAADRAERDKAVAFSKQWVDVAVAVGSSSIRTNLPSVGDRSPDLDLVAGSLSQVVEYAAKKNVVVNLENDNPVSEDPFFLVKLIEKVKSPWLHALPDFANTLATGKEEHAYTGVDAMFAAAYNICHVKEFETGQDGKQVHVDMAKTFGFLKQHGYKGHCSMEFDSPGEVYQGTTDLIEKTTKYLA